MSSFYHKSATQNDPASSIQVTKKVIVWDRYRMQIVDNGQKVLAWLSPEGRPDDPAYVRTDSTTTGVIRRVRLAINPFIVPERLMKTLQTRLAIESYLKCTTDLLQAVLRIDNTPYPTFLSTFMGLEMEDARPIGATPSGLRIFGPALTLQDFCSKPFGPTLIAHVQSVQEQRPSEERVEAAKNVGVEDVSDLPKASRTNKSPIEILLPESSEFEIALDMGYGFAERRDKSVLVQGAHLWEGTVTVEVDHLTALGSITPGR